MASRLAGDVGVDQKTIERWVSLLEASYVATRVQPFHTNLRKRMTRSPKFYFLDTGLVCHLLGIHTPEQLAPHPLRGAIFENWVASELLKETTNRGRRADLAFWRTYDGQEVDFLREDGDVIELIECKAGQTVHPRALGPLKRVGRLFEGRQVRRQLIHGGDEEMELSGVRIVPWRRIAKR